MRNRLLKTRTGYEATFAAACLGLAGCTAILGDFTSNAGLVTGDAGATDGAADVSVADSKAPAEGSTDIDAVSDAPTGLSDAAVDAAPAPLNCTTWLSPQPITLEVLSTGNRSVSALSVFALPSGRIRVIAGKGLGVPFSVYTVDPSQTPALVVQLDAPTAPNGQFEFARRSPSAINAYTVVNYLSKPATGAGSVSAYVLPDTMNGMGPLPAPFLVYQETTQNPTIAGLHVLPFSSTELFTAVTYADQSTPVNYLLGVGRATSATPAALSTAVTTPNVDDLRSPVLFHANGNVYICDENDLSSPGVSTWTVPDTGVVSTPPAKRAISGGQAAFVRDMGENSVAAAANVSYQVSAPGGAPFGYRAGTVDFAKLDTWVATDLPAVKTFTDGTMAPVFPAGSGVDSRWSGDDMMLLGPGLHGADGGVRPGLNMIWFDATGAIRAEEDGPNALLADRSDFTSSAAAAIQVGTTSAKWAVAWVETKTDDAGSYDTVMYDELDCQ